jgi:putative ABC transport system ATP-binding protein
MDTILISGRNLTREYKGDGVPFLALSDVSLDVPYGEFVALMGPSGCGKSTLLNLLGGIDRPDTGEVWIKTQRIDRYSEKQLALFRRAHVGIVFQFFNLIQNLTVRSNIELPGHLASLRVAEIAARVAELADALGIEPLLGKMPNQLSGGQRQRVAIARALINRPTLLLADEPTGALDQETGESVLGLFQKLNRAGQTILMVTHDPKVAHYAQRICLMKDGRLVEDMRPDQVASGTLVVQKGTW